MIVRTWKARATPENARSYVAFFHRALRPELARFRGHKGSLVLTRADDSAVEITVLTMWDSFDVTATEWERALSESAAARREAGGRRLDIDYPARRDAPSARSRKPGSLVIYLINPEDDDRDTGEPYLGLYTSFPTSSDPKRTEIEYVYNPVHLEE